MIRRFRLVATVAALLCVAQPAAADTAPSVWDRAKNPAIGDTYRIHLEVQRRLAQAPRDFGFSDAQESQKDTVRAMLERLHAEKSPDVRLRFDLGLVYLMLSNSQAPTYYKRAAEVIGSALALEPDHPAAEEGWSRLAEACGHIGDHDCERKAYGEVLRLTTEEGDRGTSTLNLAETEMHLGNLREALDGYREALRIASRSPSRTLAPLAMWGLAVALDRYGDRQGADRQALLVLEMQTSSGLNGLLRSSGVFFYPDYELGWYDGVGAAAQARKPGITPVEAARHWKTAEDAFAGYVRAASRPGTTDRWLELAKVRLATAKAEREKAEKKRGKAPPQPQLDDEESPL